MSTEELKHLLTEIADEVKPVPLHQHAVTRARRTGLRNAVVAGIATMAVITGGVAMAAGLGGGGSTPPAASSRDTALDGTFHSFSWKQSGETTLWRWKVGDKAATQTMVSKGDHMFAMTMEISPDGRYVAWIDKYGQPHVRDLTTGDERTLPDKVDLGRDPSQVSQEPRCVLPTWAPDSRRLFIKYADDRAVFWDVTKSARGAVTEVEAPPGCQIRVATDSKGEDLLFSLDTADNRVEIYRTRPAGGDAVKTPVGEAVRAKYQHDYVRVLKAVSPDGRLACVTVGSELDAPAGGARPENFTWQFGCNMIVELATGKVLDIEPREASKEEGHGHAARSGAWFGYTSVFDVPGHLLTVGDSGVELRDLTGRVLESGAIAFPRNMEPMTIRYVPSSSR